MAADVSVVIVNFNSGGYLRACLASLAPSEQDGLAAEVVVVDNASTTDESAHLAGAEAAGARVLRLDRNTGYAGGCNRGTAATRGRFVFLLNADVLAGRGALPALVRALTERPALGLAEPRCFVDADRVWQQPEFRLLTPGEVVGAALARLSGGFAERRSLRALEGQLAGWQAREPCAREALSGAFLATRREVLEKVGGLDEGYPLAFEDSDLFRRVRAAGWELALVPAAEAIHFAHRSRITVMEESIAKDRVGRQRYLRMHHGRSAALLERLTARGEALLGRWLRARPRTRFAELGALSTPPELELTGPAGPFVMQLALEPWFALATGQVGTGSRYRFSPATWSSLLPFPLYVRAFALPGLEPRGAWSFRRMESTA